MTFKYSGLTEDHKEVKGHIEASNRAEATNALCQKGIYATSLQHVANSSKASLGTPLSSKSPDEPINADILCSETQTPHSDAHGVQIGNAEHVNNISRSLTHMRPLISRISITFFIFILAAFSAVLIVFWRLNANTLSGVEVHRGLDPYGKENTRLTALDKEAAKTAIERWMLTKSEKGDSHYVYEIADYPDGFGNNAGRLTLHAVYELLNAAVEVRPEQITEADRLNGLEWKGRALLCYSSIRKYAPFKIQGMLFSKNIRISNDTTWTKWATNGKLPYADPDREMPAEPLELIFTKEKGAWPKLDQKISIAVDEGKCFVDFRRTLPSDLPK